jgi:hypothetical protein
MLVGERPAILRMATQAELVYVCRLQIVTGCSTVCIVAVDAAHFAFAQWMMVRHTELRPFGLVALEA